MSLISKNKIFPTFLDNEFMISNFFLKKPVFDDFQGFLAFFDAQELKLFLYVCSKLFLGVDFFRKIILNAFLKNSLMFLACFEHFSGYRI